MSDPWKFVAFRVWPKTSVMTSVNLNGNMEGNVRDINPELLHLLSNICLHTLPGKYRGIVSHTPGDFIDFPTCQANGH